MALNLFGPFRSRSDGTIAVRLGRRDRELLGELLEGFRARLEDDGDPALHRLFPQPHPGDAMAADEWNRQVRPDLVASRRRAVATVIDTLDADSLTPEQLTAWVQAANAVRLALGTRLGIEQDVEPEVSADDPELPLWGLYDWLSHLVLYAVRALTPTLPPPVDDPG